MNGFGRQMRWHRLTRQDEGAPRSPARRQAVEGLGALREALLLQHAPEHATSAACLPRHKKVQDLALQLRRSARVRPHGQQHRGVPQQVFGQRGHDGFPQGQPLRRLPRGKPEEIREVGRHLGGCAAGHQGVPDRPEGHADGHRGHHRRRLSRRDADLAGVGGQQLGDEGQKGQALRLRAAADEDDLAEGDLDPGARLLQQAVQGPEAGAVLAVGDVQGDALEDDAVFGELRV
mmetsp:Transcript_69063/g.191264  ORF Transcript_69063/g.191264 Transcript_69063/m.191264 type:complete len:233 (-) Transcript_69063:455-1153(-)